MQSQECLRAGLSTSVNGDTGRRGLVRTESNKFSVLAKKCTPHRRTKGTKKIMCRQGVRWHLVPQLISCPTGFAAKSYAALCILLPPFAGISIRGAQGSSQISTRLHKISESFSPKFRPVKGAWNMRRKAVEDP